MVTKKPKGLGRGLEALLGPKVDDAAAAVAAANDGLPTTLLLTDMVPGMYQPRTRMDEGALYELAESIKVQGIMQPILVRQLADGPNAGKYEIIAGERRSRAAKLAGLDRVPVLVRLGLFVGHTVSVDVDMHMPIAVVHVFMRVDFVLESFAQRPQPDAEQHHTDQALAPGREQIHRQQIAQSQRQQAHQRHAR